LPLALDGVEALGQGVEADADGVDAGVDGGDAPVDLDDPLRAQLVARGLEPPLRVADESSFANVITVEVEVGGRWNIVSIQDNTFLSRARPQNSKIRAA
jgi:hypothetical protein